MSKKLTPKVALKAKTTTNNTKIVGKGNVATSRGTLASTRGTVATSRGTVATSRKLTTE
jgi:hypothetical protein